MGYKELNLKLPTDFTNEQLKRRIGKQLRIRDFSFQIANKSLDARNKRNIVWQVRVGVSSDELPGGKMAEKPSLDIPKTGQGEKVAVIGSGPAGFFCAYVLQKAGYNCLLIERGSEVKQRTKSILDFERNGNFDGGNNYAFGEGGAGTFSDGKLTSRSKHISKEKAFILREYVKAGGPAEIEYMTHPHLGTDNLKRIVANLREAFKADGGEIYFDTLFENMEVKNGRVQEIHTSKGSFEVDALFVAPGHSAYETYRMLMEKGVQFRTKNFAIGSRMEHRQEIINLAQWGQVNLPGVKAAEYRITSKADGKHQVYSFCMCPGGIVVPATAYADSNIVNGMSYYNRNGKFANAACAVGVHPDELAGKEVSALDALKWVEDLEHKFYDFSQGYQAPGCSIADFIRKKSSGQTFASSYPLGILPAELWNLLPKGVSQSMRAGLQDFARKIKGFETGNLIGLESKTSAPIQVLRDEYARATGFENLFLAGEGSGYAGGIISSAADGVKAALHFINSK